MPYDVPTAAQLKAKFPRFATVADPRVTTAIVEAAGEVPVSWRVEDYQPGILYLAAHIMIVDGVLDDVGGSSVVVSGITYDTAGALSAVKVGDVEARFGASGGSSGGATKVGYAAATYGERFLELRARNTPRSYPLARA